MVGFLRLSTVEYIIYLWFLDKYTKIGVPDGQVEGKSSLCTFQIHGSKFKGKNKTGELFSPTYPGKKIVKKTYLIDKFLLRNLPKEYKMRLQVYWRPWTKNPAGVSRL